MLPSAFALRALLPLSLLLALPLLHAQETIDFDRTTPVPAEEQIPIGDFFRPHLLWSPALSPGGTHVAALVNGGSDRIQLMVYDFAKKTIQTVDGGVDRDIYDFDWLNDQRILFSTSRDKRYAEWLLATDVKQLSRAWPVLQLVVARVISIPLDRPTEPIVWIRSDVEDGRDAGLVQLDTGVQSGRLISMRADTQWTDILDARDLNNRRIIRQISSPSEDTPAGYLSDHNGKVTYAFRRDAGQFRLFYLKDKRWHPSPIDLESHDILAAGGAPFELVVSGPRREGKPALVQLMDATNGEPRGVVIDSPTHDFVGSFKRDRKTGLLIGASVQATGPQMVWFNDGYRELQRTLEGYFPGLIVRLLQTDLETTQCLVLTYSDRQPATFYRVNFSARSLELVKASRPWIDPARMRPMNVFRFKTRDGRPLEGYITLPAGTSKENPAPLVVLPHGGPWVRDEWGFDPQVQFLASRGYAVLQPNYRGSPGYDWLFPESDQWEFRKMHDDVTDAVRTILKTGMIDPARVAIGGGSFGGYLALSGVAFEPDLYRCAFTFAGVFDWETLLKDERYYRYSRSRFERFALKLGDPAQHQEKFAAISPLRHVSAIKVPVFVAHGTDDRNVQVGESRRLVAELKQHGIQHETLFVSGEGHGMGWAKNEVELQRRIEAFLAANLMPKR